jgi:hypothetical protein
MLGALSEILSLFVVAIRYARYYYLLQKVFAAYAYIPETSLATLLQQLRRALLGLWDLFGKLWDFPLLAME